MPIVVKKRVSLEFLGEEYKNSYIIVKAFSLADIDKMNDEDKEKTVRQTISERFLEGEIEQDGKMVAITEQNLLELPPVVFGEAFEQMLGKLDPKYQGLLNSPSSTTAPPPQS